ncbi:MAG TPA: hypothetical protein PLL10_06280, partial [Elusimicrobiales bacterium]|nr:hypothetical protein [Elusimicrobiales bacterium]
MKLFVNILALCFCFVPFASAEDEQGQAVNALMVINGGLSDDYSDMSGAPAMSVDYQTPFDTMQEIMSQAQSSSKAPRRSDLRGIYRGVMYEAQGDTVQFYALFDCKYRELDGDCALPYVSFMFVPEHSAGADQQAIQQLQLNQM